MGRRAIAQITPPLRKLPIEPGKPAISPYDPEAMRKRPRPTNDGLCAHVAMMPLPPRFTPDTSGTRPGRLWECTGHGRGTVIAPTGRGAHRPSGDTE